MDPVAAFAMSSECLFLTYSATFICIEVEVPRNGFWSICIGSLGRFLPMVSGTVTVVFGCPFQLSCL